MRGNSNKPKALGQARTTIASEDLPALAKWALNILRNSAPIQGLAADKITNLHVPVFLPPLSLEGEVAWATTILTFYADKLRAYGDWRRKFYAALFAGDERGSISALDGLDSECGFSLFSVANRIAANQLFGRTEKQKEYTTLLREGGDATGVPFYAYWWGARADQTGAPENFVSDILTKLQRWNVSAAHRALLRFNLLGDWPEAGGEAELLSAALSTSAIDIYEVFLGLTINAYSRGRSSAELLISALAPIADRLEDSRLSILMFLYGEGAATGLAKVDPATGEASVSLDAAKPIEITSFEDARMALLSQEATPGDDGGALSKLRRVLSATTGQSLPTLEDTFELQRLTLLFCTSSLGQWLRTFEQENSAETVFPQRETALARIIHNASAYPDAIPDLPHEAADRLLAEFGEGSFSLSVRVASASIHDEAIDGQTFEKLAPSARLDVTLRHAFRNEDWAAVVAATELFERSNGQRSKRSLVAQLLALINEGRVGDAVELAGRRIVDDSRYVEWIPFDRILEAIPRRKIRTVATTIFAPIFFATYARTRNSKLTAFASYATEDFVASLGFAKPSEAFDGGHLQSEPEATKLFLKEVCVPEILRLSTAYRSDRDLEDERLRLCKILTVIDSEHSDQYEQEARNLVRGRVIREALKELDRSKIAFDEPALRAWARRTLLPDYNRYQALLRSGIVVADPGYKEALIEALQQGIRELPELSVPKNEASALFASMVERFLHECALNPENGLDCYLSVRIRHGTISGLVRGVAEKEHIVTRTAVGSNYYKSNDHWTGRLSTGLRPDAVAAVDDLLRAFSARLDSLVGDLVENYVQVRREDKTKGLFNLKLAQTSVFALATGIKADTDFESFLDGCLSYFWSLVDSSLQAMRKQIEGNFRRILMSAYTTLETRVEKVGQSDQLTYLADAVRRSRSETSLAVDQMLEWFTMPQPSEELEFEFADLVAVSLSTVRGFYPDFEPTIISDYGDTPAFRGVLRVMSDIFFILFSNIYWYGGSMAKIKITASINDDRLLVRVENSIDQSRDISDLRSRMKLAATAIESGAYKEALPKQGGTGLLKLAKLIALKQGDADFNLGISDDEKWAFVQIPIRVVSIGEPEV